MVIFAVLEEPCQPSWVCGWLSGPGGVAGTSGEEASKHRMGPRAAALGRCKEGVGGSSSDRLAKPSVLTCS